MCNISDELLHIIFKFLQLTGNGGAISLSSSCRYLLRQVREFADFETFEEIKEELDDSTFKALDIWERKRAEIYTKLNTKILTAKDLKENKRKLFRGIMRLKITNFGKDTTLQSFTKRIEDAFNVKELDLARIPVKQRRLLTDLKTVFISIIPNLTKLSISHNQIETLKSLPLTLTHLNISAWSYFDFDFTAFPPNLEHLRILSFANVRDSETIFPSLPSSIKSILSPVYQGLVRELFTGDVLSLNTRFPDLRSLILSNPARLSLDFLNRPIVHDKLRELRLQASFSKPMQLTALSQLELWKCPSLQVLGLEIVMLPKGSLSHEPWFYRLSSLRRLDLSIHGEVSNIGLMADIAEAPKLTDLRLNVNWDTAVFEEFADLEGFRGKISFYFSSSAETLSQVLAFMSSLPIRSTWMVLRGRNLGSVDVRNFRDLEHLKVTGSKMALLSEKTRTVCFSACQYRDLGGFLATCEQLFQDYVNLDVIRFTLVHSHQNNEAEKSRIKSCAFADVSLSDEQNDDVILFRKQTLRPLIARSPHRMDALDQPWYERLE
jgi:hypothetical protein